MPTTTRTRKSGDTAGGRFTREQPQTSRRPTITPSLRRRKPEPQSGLKKAMSAVRPGAGKKQAAPSGKKGAVGGVLAIAAAAAAAAAYKSRSKLAGMIGKGDSSADEPAGSGETVNNASPPSTPAV